ncbi:MAG: hypothetical protein ACKVYV_00470 [Limisphaerales bacterium]
MIAAGTHALGLIVSAAAGTRGHRHALGLAHAARGAGVAVRAVVLTQPGNEIQETLRTAGAECGPPEELATIIAGAGRVMHFT